MDDARQSRPLSPEEQGDDADLGLMPDAGLSARIRSVRTRRRLSMSKLAEMAQVSKSLIHQIERGTAKPSIDTVRKLASALGVPVFSLFLGDLNSQMVVRKNERRLVSYAGSRVEREILSPSLNGRMVVLRVTFPPYGTTSSERVRHVGEECVVVLAGTLEVGLGQESVRLEEGDSMTFDSELPHVFNNPTDRTTEAIVVISPPNI